MTKRKGLSKKTRFEVFKRDSFTCQYCGAQAPDAVLVVDHINPVAGGGENDIMNLVTSCEPCNQGKGARALDDNSVIAKQKAQLDELNERREQLEMMLQWRQALASLDDDIVDAFEATYVEQTTFHLSDYGKGQVRKWLKKHTLAELLEALEASAATYFKPELADDRPAMQETAGKAFNMIPAIIRNRQRQIDKPWMKDLYYIRAIIRNRMYCNERVAIDLLEQAYNLDAPLADLQDWAKRARNWTNWRNEMETWIEELEAGSAPEGEQ